MLNFQIRNDLYQCYKIMTINNTVGQCFTLAFLIVEIYKW